MNELVQTPSEYSRMCIQTHQQFQILPIPYLPLCLRLCLLPPAHQILSSSSCFVRSLRTSTARTAATARRWPRPAPWVVTQRWGRCWRRTRRWTELHWWLLPWQGATEIGWKSHGWMGGKGHKPKNRCWKVFERSRA